MHVGQIDIVHHYLWEFLQEYFTLITIGYSLISYHGQIKVNNYIAAIQL